MQKDYFKTKARDYDKEKSRTQNVENIAQGILENVSFTKSMSVLDFGSGTGLLLAKIAPFVKEITAVDISKSMNEVLKSKADSIDCKLEIIEMDLTKESLNKKYDSIISSMTFHHIADVKELFKRLFLLIKENGTIAIADLDEEDGSFHTMDTGVFHNGFDREEFKRAAENAGFKDVNIQAVSIAKKPTRNYPIFLMTGTKLM